MRRQLGGRGARSPCTQEETPPRPARSVSDSRPERCRPRPESGRCALA